MGNGRGTTVRAPGRGGRGNGHLAALIEKFKSDGDPATGREIIDLLGLDSTGGTRIDSTVRVVISPAQPKPESIEPLSEERDETDESSLTAWKSLESHTAGVLKHADRFARGCGISNELVDDIRLAARMHDWGKYDERFQASLTGKQFNAGTCWAKSGENLSMADQRKLRKAAGYPEGARHEAASVMAARGSQLLREAHDPDLVLHLIGTHHGCGRPLFPVWDEHPGFRVVVKAEGNSFETSDGGELARFDCGWIERFAILNRRYGYWGLAYLEAILRRADCMQSRKEERDAATKAHSA